jgi:uncharacterized protein YcfL
VRGSLYITGVWIGQLEDLNMKRLLGLLLVGCGKSDLAEEEAEQTRVLDSNMAIQSLEKIGGSCVASPCGTVEALHLYDAQHSPDITKLAGRG